MDSPFLSNYYYGKQQPSSSQRTRYSPIHGEPATETTKPKVVSIPVHFVGSETARSKSVLKIQKVLRGFLVRKSVQKIGSIKKEVEEIERRVWDKQTAALIRKEAKERLRLNEMLMGSLFKLDSIRGVDVGVRDLRKSVIKKAIGLQEKLDAIAAAAADHEEIDSGAGGLADGEEEENEHLEKEAAQAPGANINMNININMMEEDEEEKGKEMIVSTCQQQNMMLQSKEVDDDDDEHDIERQMAEKKSSSTAAGGGEEGEGLEKSNGDGEEEKMNEKMIGMMNDLIHKNEIQTQLLASLTHRVALLEKAFLCDQLRKSHKKKKTNP